MQCHKCRWRRRIERGEFRGVPWERTPCSRCKLVESSAGTLPFNDALPAPEARRAEDDGLLLPVAVMAEAMHALLSIPPATLRIVYLRYQGRRYREIGRVLGVSAAAVEMRHWRAMQRWPILKEVFPAKEARRARRGSRQGGGGGEGLRG